MGKDKSSDVTDQEAASVIGPAVWDAAGWDDAGWLRPGRSGRCASCGRPGSRCHTDGAGPNQRGRRARTATGRGAWTCQRRPGGRARVRREDRALASARSAAAAVAVAQAAPCGSPATRTDHVAGSLHRSVPAECEGPGLLRRLLDEVQHLDGGLGSTQLKRTAGRRDTGFLEVLGGRKDDQNL